MTKTNISSTLPATNHTGSVEDIRGLKGPVPIPDVWFWIGSFSALLLTVLLAAWLIRRHRRKKSIPTPVTVVPPHERAFERLNEALKLIDQPPPFCIAVSDTVRTYLEERFTLHAPDRTTEEFLDELQESPLLSLDQKRVLGSFLERCDLVKFARFDPGQSELQALHEAAVRLVTETQAPATEPMHEARPETSAPGSA